jgi:hypothetical protein
LPKARLRRASVTPATASMPVGVAERKVPAHDRVRGVDVDAVVTASERDIALSKGLTRAGPDEDSVVESTVGHVVRHDVVFGRSGSVQAVHVDGGAAPARDDVVRDPDAVGAVDDDPKTPPTPPPSDCERSRLAELARINLASQPTSRAGPRSDSPACWRPARASCRGRSRRSGQAPSHQLIVAAAAPHHVAPAEAREPLPRASAPETAQVLRRARVGSSVRPAPRWTVRSRRVRSASRTHRWPLAVLPTAAAMLVLGELALLLVPRIA